MPLVGVSCPLCAGSGKELLYPATPGYDPLSADVSCTSPELAAHGVIVRCTSCGMVFADPQPDPGSLLEAYRDVRDPRYVEEDVGRLATFADSLAHLEEHRRPPGLLLDVGCYTGVFLRVASRSGWTVRGQELSRWAAEQARGLGLGPVEECEVHELALAPGSVDVVTMWDVVEHVSDPNALVGAAGRLLRPGGLLALSTHLVDSAMARLLGRRYPFLMGMHLCHFTRETLRRLMEVNGFAVRSIRPHLRSVPVRYLADRVGRLLPLLRPLPTLVCRPAWVGRRLVRVGGLGLVELYAVRM